MGYLTSIDTTKFGSNEHTKKGNNYTSKGENYTKKGDNYTEKGKVDICQTLKNNVPCEKNNLVITQ